MKYSAHVKPISFLKTYAADELLDLADRRERMFITQNGEVKAVLRDIATYEQAQDSLALLKLLALGNQDIAAGRAKPAREVVQRLKMKASAD
ncbi:type II toxin-antitoxin system Phd/YefM family antitoxin [Sphingosinicella soli]|uniref:Antitoxin n=1 Tax=Sphingosinicella soli TaxID=333708 RepID=A0A7W7B2L4_9SPHN|nr:type II toxin-antitoxin system Phd/YefM family antitoxin [Sphingosinicella soli]MBB4632791.1 PHD/YefM family antitoxin component YafN of YafNO toxin-antitoxin module [Sphingosinicella soli]